jgi:hypothetical protein
MITSFPSPESDNIAGCQSFTFIEDDKVQNIPVSPGRKITSDIVLTQGASWLSGYATSRTLSFEEKMQENDAGKYFLTEINGFYPKLCPEAIELFTKMKDSRFIVVVTDNNGYKRVCGTTANPMNFTFDQDSGSRVSARNGFTFRFRCQSLQESPFLV